MIFLQFPSFAYEIWCRSTDLIFSKLASLWMSCLSYFSILPTFSLNDFREDFCIRNWKRRQVGKLTCSTWSARSWEPRYKICLSEQRPWRSPEGRWRGGVSCGWDFLPASGGCADCPRKSVPMSSLLTLFFSLFRSLMRRRWRANLKQNLRSSKRK